MRTRVKICGITRLEDAMVAVEAGADALGFVFCDSSPRNVSIEVVASIVRQLPPYVSSVGVFVNAPMETIRRTVESAGLGVVQLHGDESPEFAAGITFASCYKAFRVRDERALETMRPFATRAWLMDSYVAGQLGGTGERFNWDLAVRAQSMGRPVILAGGLTPGNIAEAILQVRPYAVDVSSGVELRPGIKDPALVRSFLVGATKG